MRGKRKKKKNMNGKFERGKTGEENKRVDIYTELRRGTNIKLRLGLVYNMSDPMF